MKVIGQGLDGNYLFSVSKEEIKELLKASGMTDNNASDVIKNERNIIGHEFQIEGIGRLIDDVVDLQNNYYFKELKAKLGEMVKMFDAFNNRAVAFREQAKMIDKSRRRKN